MMSNPIIDDERISKPVAGDPSSPLRSGEDSSTRSLSKYPSWVFILMTFVAGFICHEAIGSSIYRDQELSTNYARAFSSKDKSDSLSGKSGPSLVIGVMIAGGLENYRVDCMLNTWLTNEVPPSVGTIETIFFYDSTLNVTQYPSYPSYVYLPYPGYPPNRKNKAMWEWFITERPDADFYMKLDSDSYLFGTQLLLYLGSLGSETDLNKFAVGCCSTFPSGAGYVMSSNTAKIMMKDLPAWWECQSSAIEDVAFGKCAYILGNTSLTVNPQFIPQWPHRPEYKTQRWIDKTIDFGESWPILFHHLDPACFDHIHDVCVNMMKEELHNHPNFNETRNALNFTYIDLLDRYGCPENQTYTGRRGQSCKQRRTDYTRSWS